MNNILYDSQTIGKKYVEIVLENAQKVNLKDSIAIAEESLIKSVDKDIEKFNQKAIHEYLESIGVTSNQEFENYINLMKKTEKKYRTYFNVSDINDIHPNFKKKRNCYKQLEDYINSKEYETKVCAIYGIRRTGKTVLMEQAVEALSDEQKQKALFITCERKTNFHDIIYFVEDAIKDGYKYFFIDEITYAEDFQYIGSILSDVFVSKNNARIVITGTDSLGLSLVSRDIMYDRLKFIPTTYTSFAEYSELTGINNLDDYIKFGSTLQTNSFSTHDKMEEYIETSIVENIINSIKKTEGVRTYPPTLTELYNNQDLENSIQRIINKYSQTITIDALKKQFKVAPFSTAIKTLQKTPSHNFIYSEINSSYVNETIKKILNVDNLKTSPITNEHIKDLSKFLERLGVISTIPVLQSYTDSIYTSDLKIINHPGMYHANIKYTLETIRDDKSWFNQVSIEDKNVLLEKTYSIAMGIILENIIINDVYQLLSNGRKVDKVDIFGENTGRWYVSKLTFDDSQTEQYHEADLIIFDKEKKETYLFEIKHSNKAIKEQSIHLENKVFSQYVEKHFGKIKKTAVLYNGETDCSLKVPRISAAKFLKELTTQFNTKDFDMNKFIDSLLSNSPQPKLTKKRNDDYGYGR